MSKKSTFSSVFDYLGYKKQDIIILAAIATTIAAILMPASKEAKETANQLESKVRRVITTELQHENENPLYPSQERERHITFY
jgi:hypothetical protein